MDFEDDDENWMTQAAEAAENDELCRTTQPLMSNSNATELPRTGTYMSDSHSASANIKQRLTSATMRVSQLEADLKKKKEESDTHSRLYLTEKRKCSDLERQVKELKNAHNAEVEMLNAQLAEDWRRLAVREKLVESKGISDKQDTAAGFCAVDHRPYNAASTTSMVTDALPQQNVTLNDSDVKVRPVFDNNGAIGVNLDQMKRRSISFGTTGDTVPKRRAELQIEAEHDAEDVVRCLLDDFSQLLSVRNAEDVDADKMVQASGRFVFRLASDIFDSANGLQFSRLFEMLTELTMALETVFLRESDVHTELAHVNVVCLMRASVALLQSAMCTQVRCKCDVQTQLVISNVMARQFDVLRVGLFRFSASTPGHEQRPVTQLLHSGLQVASQCLTFCATRISNVAALSTVQRALLTVEKPTEQVDANPNLKFSRSSSISHQSQSVTCCFVCWSCTTFRSELRHREPKSCDERYSLVRCFGQFANGLLGLVSCLRLRNVHLPRACRWPSALLKALVSALNWLRAAEQTMEVASKNSLSNVPTTSVRNDEFQLIALTLRSCVNDDYLRREVGRIQLLDPIELAQTSSEDSSAHNFVNACYSLLEQEAMGDRLAEAALRKFCSVRARSNN